MKKNFITLVTILLIIFILFNVISCVRLTPIKNDDEIDVKLPDDGNIDDTDNFVTIELDMHSDIKLFDPFLEENPGIKLVRPGQLCRLVRCY
jgi:hypothetical protein